MTFWEFVDRNFGTDGCMIVCVCGVLALSIIGSFALAIFGG